MLSITTQNDDKAETETNRVHPNGGEASLNVLLLATFFGLMTGIGEVVLLAFKKYYMNRLIFQSRHVIWMAPLADVILFAIPALILWVLSQRWKWFSSLRLTVTTLSFLGYLSLISMYTPLHRLAVYVLSLGLAIQTSRLITIHSEKFNSLVHRTTKWLIVIMITLILIMVINFS